jgi:long-chain acyl-CoA synthetase
VFDWLGEKITEYYGATEGGIISLISSEEWLERGGSLGKPLETIEVIVVDESGKS